MDHCCLACQCYYIYIGYKVLLISVCKSTVYKIYPGYVCTYIYDHLQTFAWPPFTVTTCMYMLFPIRRGLSRLSYRLGHTLYQEEFTHTHFFLCMHVCVHVCVNTVPSITCMMASATHTHTHTQTNTHTHTHTHTHTYTHKQTHTQTQYIACNIHEY